MRAIVCRCVAPAVFTGCIVTIHNCTEVLLSTEKYSLAHCSRKLNSLTCISFRSNNLILIWRIQFKFSILSNDASIQALSDKSHG
jgi:hypothetical protein